MDEKCGGRTRAGTGEVSSPEQLQVAGLVPFSSVDWPGKLAAALFLQGCPWRCPYCHNAEILDPRTPGTVDWSQVEDLLQRRAGLLDGVVFSGGEALMQGRLNTDSPLEAAVRRVKELGFTVGLHTGGAFPERLRRLLDHRLIDWVGLDVKAMPAEYPLATASPVAAVRVQEAMGVLAQHAAAEPDFEWETRLTLWPGLVASQGRSPSGTALLSYAGEVASWARDLGADVFALQQYRIPASGVGSGGPEVAWDPAEARRELAVAGFPNAVIR